jgi:predicted DNA-binding transcriptional regulator YafY
MSEGVPIARSTFNRHRDAILDMFGIVIDCDKKDGFRYFIYNEEVLAEESIQNWMLSTLSVNSELAESKGVHDRILLESIPSDGTYLHRFIEAMKKGVRVSVQYRRYGSDQSSYMKVNPYFVKLHGRRWYALVKLPEPTAYLLTLAFDRIKSLELTNEKYAYDRDFDPAGWFRDCYGIVKDEEVPVEKVVIRAFGKEANYLRDLPLHHSQQEIEAGEGYTDFALILRPTADFFSPLLARGAAIKILGPQWLADEIRQQHQAAMALYD